MFISNEEKNSIKNSIGIATNQISQILSIVATLQKRVIDLENTTIKMAAKVKKPKKVLTPEQRAKQREYQKLYKARKKQELTQGTTNVSA